MKLASLELAIWLLGIFLLAVLSGLFGMLVWFLSARDEQ